MMSDLRVLKTEIYIEAFDDEMADQVWEAWNKREIDDSLASLASLLVAAPIPVPDTGCRLA